MNLNRRTGGLSLLLALALSGSVWAQPAAPTSEHADAKKWADQIWASAVHRDQETFERSLQAIPTDVSDREAALRLRDSLQLRQTNSVQARAKRDERVASIIALICR